jgi:ribosome-associated heat shock protein Hsp15
LTAPALRSAGSGSGAPAGTAGSQRLDKWLWFARIVKSRTLAATLIAEGKFRINRDKVDKPSVTVKPGDVVTSASQRSIRVLRVVAIGARRGPASEAQTLYEDLTPPEPPRQSEPSPAIEREAGSGRPTKKERRLTDRLRGR